MLNGPKGPSWLMWAYKLLLKAVQAKGMFQRNKIPLETKILACLLYMAGLSYRAMTMQTGIIQACYRSVHYWVQKFKEIGLGAKKKARRLIAIDETKLKVNGRQAFVWAAIDVESRELLAIYASYQRSSLNSYVFLRKVLKACTNKPLVLVDKGPWYPWALDRLGLKWQHVTFGKRNYIERLFRTLKERTKAFYNNVNSKRGAYSLILFLNLFMLWYNYLRWHQGIRATPGGELI